MRVLIFGLVFFSAAVLAQEPTVKFSVSDTIHAGEDLNVKVIIDKTGISGFAKFELFIPPGFDPEIIEPAGSTVICRYDIIKFIWIDLPESPGLVLKIKFETDKRLEGKKELYGRFHFISENKRSWEKLPVRTVFIKNNVKSNIPEEEFIASNKKYTVPSSGINVNDTVYRVQIGAYRRKIPGEILSEFYSDPTMFMEEVAGGFHKYTIGDFPSFFEAAEFRDNCGVHGAFIVKYIKGKRK